MLDGILIAQLIEMKRRYQTEHEAEDDFYLLYCRQSQRSWSRRLALLFWLAICVSIDLVGTATSSL